ncbi:hypothetical protein NP493_130g00006 [Ridgeia piscesae]|uniref:TIR domain-containing protein n=1 Tax=Ridgeia piscesae TaxID=27915 RepID=A0AAD9P5F7_RIDPI|nr:hypothetical protein NP493_130g00006 [Ridgeia piscesae]
MSSAAQLGISPGLSRLLLASNSIKAIKQDSLFGYDNLTSLTLDDNSIRTISGIAFAPIPHLKVLNCVSHADIVVTLSTAAVIFLSAIVFALVCRGRWYIRYYIFLIRSRRRRHLDRADGSYVYDAFVAHNSNDASWVVRHLLPRLETEGRYRLCLHQRDWPIGREISENIVESIEASRKVIVVLSNNFAQSQWCRMELEMANHRRLSNWRNSLVLVLLETISPENQTATLRNLLTTHTYLEWKEREQEKFWRALKKALRPPKGAPPTEMRTVE